MEASYQNPDKQINELEGLQRRAVKWILREEYTSYSPSTYIQKCKQLKIMPIEDRFDFLDLIFFFKIVKRLVPVELPPYIVPYKGNSRLRNSHLDDLSFTSTIQPLSSTNAFARGFFFRTHTKWNHIPHNIREMNNIAEFKSNLTTHMWDKIMSALPSEVSDSEACIDMDL